MNCVILFTQNYSDLSFNLLNISIEGEREEVLAYSFLFEKFNFLSKLSMNCTISLRKIMSGKLPG
jgi:hypothetical protein